MEPYPFVFLALHAAVLNAQRLGMVPEGDVIAAPRRVRPTPAADTVQCR